MSSNESQPGPSDDAMIVLVSEPERPKRRRRPAVPRPGRTVTLTVAVPSELADELKHTISVLPGQSLNALMAEALRRMLASHGLSAPPRRRHSDADDRLIVIAS